MTAKPAGTYDSRPETYTHIGVVRGFLTECCIRLLQRANVHDASKVVEPELSVFDVYTPKLKDSTYGSDEYKEFLVGMGEGLKHHYAHNSHHPEYYDDGIAGMDLLDVVEMLCDWKAATMRHADGDLGRSIEVNQKRFGYDDQVKGMLRNTAERLGWLAPPSCTCGWATSGRDLLDGGHQPGCAVLVR